MTQPHPCLKIIFPEFFNHVASHDPKTLDQTFPYLARLINRASIDENIDLSLEHELLAAFGWQTNTDQLPNITELTAVLDNIEYSDNLFRADPVHLRPDGVRLRLFHGRYFAPDESEARALIEELNRQFPDCQFYQGQQPSRWYVRLPSTFKFNAKTPSQINQQALDEHLPTGPDAKRLHSLMNEFQMALHQSAINGKRESQGEPPLNSVWIWGGGERLLKLPTLDLATYGDDLLASGLVKISAATHHNLTDLDGVLKRKPRASISMLIFNNPTGSLIAAGAEIDLPTFEQRWCADILKCLKLGKFKQIQIIDSGRRLTISMHDAWKFWRRSTYFSDRLKIDIDPQKISMDVLPNETAQVDRLGKPPK